MSTQHTSRICGLGQFDGMLENVMSASRYIRVQLKPQATPEGTEDADANKAIIDEVDVRRESSSQQFL